MPVPKYRDRALDVTVGDFVRGWSGADALEEVSGVVVSVHGDQQYGANVQLAVFDMDEHPDGAELDPEELPPGALHFKNHQGRACLLTARTVEAHADRLELVFRRSNLDTHRGVLRRADPEAEQARLRVQQSRQRQQQAQSFVPPKGPDPTRSPVVSTPPPEPPPEDAPEQPHPARAGARKDEPKGSKK